jgi:hypothetical protein
MRRSCQSYGTAPTSTGASASYRSGNIFGSASIYEHRKTATQHEKRHGPSTSLRSPSTTTTTAEMKKPQHHLNGTRAARSIIAPGPGALLLHSAAGPSVPFRPSIWQPGTRGAWHRLSVRRDGDLVVIRGRERAAQETRRARARSSPAALRARVSHSIVYSCVRSIQCFASLLKFE